MPTILRNPEPGAKKAVPVYHSYTWLEPNIDLLKAFRANSARMRDVLLDEQKRALSEWAKFFKQEAAHHLKMFRAADGWVKWVAGDGGPPRTFPHDLGAYFDYVQAVCSPAPQSAPSGEGE